MDLVVVSSARRVPNEVSEVIRMFNSGLSAFHIRKPRWSKKELSEYIAEFPPEYRKKLVLHTYHGLAGTYALGGIHLSRSHRRRGKFYDFKIWLKRKLRPGLIVTRTFHKLTDITHDRRKYTYAFLSPVFDSVSRATLAGGFSRRALLIVIPQAKQPIYAMGGVTSDKIKIIDENGFDGAVLHGSLWDGDESPYEKFIKTQDAILSLRQQ
jgi:thiamine-phosphate pyrophosphorylase